MLFKGGTGVAAANFLALDPSVTGNTAPAPVSEAGAAKDALVLAHADNQVLHARLEQMQREWSDGLVQARETGRREAAAEHVRDDEVQRLELSGALAAARDSFVAALHGTGQALAVQLAVAALRCLVQVRQDDEDWLLRFVAHRLAGLDAASIVAVILPDGCRPIADRLETPTGTSVLFDPGLAPGSARIDLAMGGIPIRIDQGLARIFAVLEPECEPHG